ncbi:MAG: PspC domain-containing protein [Candidatus Bipolaricaulaceae bacterium]
MGDVGREASVEGRLHRSRTERMLGGVCGGLGEYFGLDPNLVRVVFVLLALANGIGVILYLILWLILPPHGEAMAPSDSVRQGAEEIGQRARAWGEEAREAAAGLGPRIGLLLGGILIALGVIFLLRNFGVFWAPWLRLELLWPVLLIVAGLALLLRGRRGGGR